jgi:hypothetical protein
MNWSEANQQYLTAQLARLRERVRTALPEAASDQSGQSSLAALDAAIAQAEAQLGAPSALQQLVRLFNLTAFERDCLLLAAGVELDSELARLCAAVQGDAQRAFVTPELALACLPAAHWNALLPAAPLRYWRLLEASGNSATLLRSQLRIDERILHYLTGEQYLDERLDALLHHVEPQDLPPSQTAVVERLTQAWRTGAGSLPVLALCGQETPALHACAAQVAAQLKLQLFALAASDIPATPVERNALARLWEREAALGGYALLLDGGDEVSSALTALADRIAGPLFIATRWPQPLALTRPLLRWPLAAPSAHEQQMLWRQTLGEHGASLNGYVPRLATQFELSPAAIATVGREVLTQLPADAAPHELEERLWDACRQQARPRLDDLAQRLETRAQWSDLVLPPAQLQTLREIVTQVRHRQTVHDEWGFAERGTRGLGSSVVFAGASGVGKTLAAEVMANELRLDLYRIDLSAVVSKYIGETEKNLRRIFAAAEHGGVILLFDEADALFGKRSDVKDSHDRYANLEVSFLLQQMEAYRGLAMLTTNMLSAFDQAFLRRLRFIVQFPFPAAEQRAAIWRKVFPATTPTEALDYQKLARLNLTGGHIRNIALNAAFLAAGDQTPVRMGHLRRAALSEYAKLERPLTSAEVSDWAAPEQESIESESHGIRA